MSPNESEEIEYDDGAETPELELTVNDIEERLRELESENSAREVGSGVGYSFGAALAMILSWHSFHAVLWALLAGIFSWGYVIYYVIVNWSTIKML